MGLLILQSLLSALLAARGTFLTNQHLVYRFECPSGVISVALSPDGNRLAASCEEGWIMSSAPVGGSLLLPEKTAFLLDQDSLFESGDGAVAFVAFAFDEIPIGPSQPGDGLLLLADFAPLPLPLRAGVVIRGSVVPGGEDRK